MTDLITPLNAWLAVVREEDIDKEDLVRTTHDLRMALDPPYQEYGHLHGKYFTIRRNLLMLSAQFLWDDYTDSNTDEPCDLEWDVHHLQAEMDPTHTFSTDPNDPDSVLPAYVGTTVYPTPVD